VEVRHIRGDGTVFSAAAIRAALDETPAKQLTLW
jgi:hypothetical protein